MSPNLEKLVSISSEPLSPKSPSPVELGRRVPAGLSEELVSLLRHKNGFYAFEGALHVFPSEPAEAEPGLAEWNDKEGWRQAYGRRVKGLLFFAEDILANQFALGPDGVYRFEPESGEVSRHSDSLEGWAAKILEDYNYETGWDLAREWQLRHGPLPPAMRLLPKKPFTLGGEYEAENLVAVPCEAAMAQLGALYEQICAVPDGQAITVHGWLGELGT